MFKAVIAGIVFVLMGIVPAGAVDGWPTTGWVINENVEEPRVYQRNIRLGDDMAIMTVADAPKLRFIPICEALSIDPGTIECIPQSAVDAQALLIATRNAGLKLRQCTKVIVDPTKPKTSTNIGFRCNGILTGSGLIPDPQE